MDIKEVAEQVQKEIKAIGELSKKNYEELNKRVEEMHTLQDKQGTRDVVTKEHLTKLAEDVTLRQDAIDKAAAVAAARVDKLEVAFKRTPMNDDSQSDEKLEKEARELLIQKNAFAGKSLSWKASKQLEVNVKEYQEYKKSFEEFLRVDEKMISPETFKALRLGSDPDGGYTVTPAMSAQIVLRLFEMDPIRQLASVETISTDALEMLEDVNQAGADWESETVANSESETPQWKKKRISVHVLAARPRATQVLLDDSGLNIENWLSNKVADKFARTEAAAFVTGNGIGKPRGFMTYDAWSTAGTYEYGKIEQVNMGHATEFTTDGLIDVKYSMIEQHLMVGTWLTNRLNVRDIMKLKDGDGQYIWRPGITEGQPSTLLGLPLRMATTIATTGASALAIALADFKAAYQIVDRQGINVQRDPYTVKPFVEFYTRKRVGGDVINYQAIKIGKVSA